MIYALIGLGAVLQFIRVRGADGRIKPRMKRQRNPGFSRRKISARVSGRQQKHFQRKETKKQRELQAAGSGFVFFVSLRWKSFHRTVE